MEQLELEFYDKYFDDSSDRTFTITEEELRKANQIITGLKDPSIAFVIEPGPIGSTVSIIDRNTNKVYNITDYSNW